MTHARLVGVDGTGGTTAGGPAPTLTPRPVAASVEELIDGWEKTLGGADELGWWSDRARAGARWL
jgi:hypothetical protein